MEKKRKKRQRMKRVTAVFLAILILISNLPMETYAMEPAEFTESVNVATFQEGDFEVTGEEDDNSYDCFAQADPETEERSPETI